MLLALLLVIAVANTISLVLNVIETRHRRSQKLTWRKGDLHLAVMTDAAQSRHRKAAS